MDEIIPLYYREFGSKDNIDKLPSSIDGLKVSERRTLLSLYEIARNRLTKSFKIDGYCIGNYHPHGSVYGTMVFLAEQGFLLTQGNWGSNIGVESENPGAPRYTECKLKEFISDMAFEYINVVPWDITETDTKEPLFLPTMFPFCLIGKTYTLGIGFGYRGLFPCFKKEDLWKRLLYLINGDEEIEKPLIKPIPCELVTSSDEEITKLLELGEAKINFKCRYEVDKDNYKIHLKSLPYNRSFQTLLKIFNDELESSDIGYVDESANYETDIVFSVIKQRNKAEIFERVLKKFDENTYINYSVGFSMYCITKEGKVVIKSVDDFLIETYGMYLKCFKRSLIKKKESLVEKINEFEMLEKIRPHLAEYISNNKKVNTKKCISYINSMIDINKDDIKKILSKYRINSLLSLEIDKKELRREVRGITKDLEDCENIVVDKYDEFLGRICNNGN